MKLKPTVVKAQRTLISLSQEIQLEGYMMPDGQYTLNPTSLARAIRKHRAVLLEFLGGKSPQAQACKGFEMLEIERIAVEGRGNRIKPIPLYVAAAFLRYWDKRGNAQAGAIIEALTTGHLISLFDDAFGIKRTASERREILFEYLSPQGITATQQLDKAIEQMEKLIESQEAELALERARVESLQRLTDAQTSESLKVLEEKQELKQTVIDIQQKYRTLKKSHEQVEKEKRKLETELAMTSKECLEAYKKVTSLHECLNDIRKKTLLAASKNGW
jgi:hypothetical protein